MIVSTPFSEVFKLLYKTLFLTKQSLYIWHSGWETERRTFHDMDEGKHKGETYIDVILTFALYR